MSSIIEFKLYKIGFENEVFLCTVILLKLNFTFYIKYYPKESLKGLVRS